MNTSFRNYGLLSVAALFFAACNDGLTQLPADDGTEFINAEEPDVRYSVSAEAMTRDGSQTTNPLPTDAFKVCAWYYDATRDETGQPAETLYNDGKEILLVGHDLDGTEFQGEVVSRQSDAAFGDGTDGYYGVWNTTIEHWWPKPWFTVDFYATCPNTLPNVMLTANANPADPYIYKGIPFSVMPDEKAADITDMLYAFESVRRGDKPANYADGAVKLSFHHALSQINFRGAVKETNKDWIVEVSGITLHNVHTKGIFDIGRGAFNPSSMTEKSDFQLPMKGGNPASPFGPLNPLTPAAKSDPASPYRPIVITYDEQEPDKSYELTDTANPRVLMGQTLTAWDYENHEKIEDTEGCYLSVLCHIWRKNQDGNPEELLDPDRVGNFVNIYIPFSPVWEAGKKYTYTLHFGGGYDEDGWPNIVETEITVSVTDWVQGEESSGSAEFN